MSHYPHSTLATSISTSPYAVHQNFESLMQRRRRGSNTSTTTARPSRWSIDRTMDWRAGGGPGAAPALRRGESDVSLGMSDDVMMAHGDDDSKKAVVGGFEDSAGDGSGVDRGTGTDGGADGDAELDRRGRRVSFTGRGYGAVSSSEPLQAAVGAAPLPVPPNAPAGNSRSRSKGRTPPRNIVRPMTRQRRDAAIAAGAHAGAVASVDDSAGSVISALGDDGEGGSPAIATPGEHARSPPLNARGRGRSTERRPISPAVAFRPLYQFDPLSDVSDDDEGEMRAAVEAARSNLYLPGAAGTGEPLSDDPATALGAEDLDLPVDACGHEVHSWRGALGVELPLLIRSTIPVFFTQLAEYSLSLASVVSIGHLGTADLAASSLANMTASVTCFSIMQGLATSLDTLLPAAWTGADPRHVGLWTMRCSVVMIAAMVVLLKLKQEPRVAALAGQYLAWLSLGIPGYAGTVVLKKYLQSQNIMHIPTYVLFIVAPLNVVFNWLLVWGPKSIRLGFIGGAVATALSLNLTLVLLLVYVLYYGPRDTLHPFSVKAVFSRLGTVSQLGLAGTVMMSSEWWAWEVCALAAALLGSTALAAQSVLLSTCSTLYQFPAALGVAASVRVGNLLGAGRSWEAKWASRASFILATGFALFNSAICIVFRYHIGLLFNSDPEVVGMVAAVMPWIGLFQVMDGVSGAANAILRALALHSLGAAVSFTAYYGVGIPFGLWLTFKHDMGLVGIWVGLAVALTYGSAIGVAIVWRTNWETGVARVRGRLGLAPLAHDAKFADDDNEDGGECVDGPHSDANGATPRPNGSPARPAAADPERQPLLSS